MSRTTRFLIALLALSTIAATAEAKPFGYVQASVQAQNGTPALPTLDGSLGWTVPQTKDQLGFLAFVTAQPNWAQMYFGPTYNPSLAPWLTVGLHVGAQQDLGRYKTFSLRYAVSTQVYVDKFSFIGFVEFENKSFKGDNSNLMYDLTAKYNVFGIVKAEPTGDNTQFAINVIAKGHRTCGIGPGMEFQVPVAYTTVWVSWMPLEPEGLPSPGNRFNPSRFWTGVAVGF